MSRDAGRDGLRIAVLHSRLSPHMAACFRTLCTQHDAELLVVRIPAAGNAPFDDRHFDWIDQLYDRDALNTADMTRMLESFSPDAIFMSGWFDEGYLSVARAMREQNVLVVAGSDEQWTGSWRQQGARLIAPWYLHSAIDVLWVAGERQRQFAHRLGFRGAQCWDGVYACDWEQFATHRTEPLHRAFLFVGRYIRRKGVDLLADAYATYREQVEDPWPLLCAGSGEEEALLEHQEGIDNRGFVQPDALPDLMGRAGAFVLPSREEPWGVVVAEAAAAGLPLICSEACGSAVHLLRDRYNGYLVQSGRAGHLAHCLATMSRASDEERSRMGARSHELSKQYTPTQWADTLTTGIRDWYASDRSPSRASA
jgi:glycosyltransferase involved in cell wall biosynthesis